MYEIVQATLLFFFFNFPYLSITFIEQSYSLLATIVTLSFNSSETKQNSATH